ncbi:methenyltetrahydrofolate cyclohydrolase [Sporolactobacillus sp. THM19-2]|nr:methenyltetrahydrofolate cyclohydrolase [Sporolactobacillus sp. THM19-2]
MKVWSVIMKVFDQTLRQFIEASGSKSPVPGGGSVAAVSAALGASMGAMVARLTSGLKYHSVSERMNEIIRQMEAAIQTFEHFAAEDMDSFKAFMDALHLPKVTDEQRADRTSALQKAAIHAAEIPISLMTECRDTAQILAASAELFNKNVKSDLGVAVILLEASAQSAWLTAQINFKYIKDLSLRNKLQEQGNGTLKHIQKTKEQILNIIS